MRAILRVIHLTLDGRDLLCPVHYRLAYPQLSAIRAEIDTLEFHRFAEEPVEVYGMRLERAICGASPRPFPIDRETQVARRIAVVPLRGLQDGGDGVAVKRSRESSLHRVLFDQQGERGIRTRMRDYYTTRVHYTRLPSDIEHHARSRIEMQVSRDLERTLGTPIQLLQRDFQRCLRLEMRRRTCTPPAPLHELRADCSCRYRSF